MIREKRKKNRMMQNKGSEHTHYTEIPDMTVYCSGGTSRTLKRRLCVRTLLLFLLVLPFLGCSQRPVYPEAPQTGQEISVDISTLQPDIPRFFSYRYQGRNINFFVVKTEESVLSFLDACMKCYPRKLGFRFDDGSFVCRACDERYPVSEIEKGFGSCYPIRIEGKTKGGKYLLSAAILEKAGEKYFK